MNGPLHALSCLLVEPLRSVTVGDAAADFLARTTIVIGSDRKGRATTRGGPRSPWRSPDAVVAEGTSNVLVFTPDGSRREHATGTAVDAEDVRRILHACVRAASPD